MIRRALICSACLLVISCASSRTPPKTDPSVAPGINARFATEEGRAASLQLLEGEGRDQYQKPDEVIRNMALKPGDVVCEVGAGSGYFTPFLSKAVGSSGRVYAQDPQAEFLEVLKKKKTSQGLNNAHASDQGVAAPGGAPWM